MTQTLIRPIFPEGVVTCEEHPLEGRGKLFPQEEEQIARSVPNRQREFIAGRQCAHRAIAVLGLPDQPLLNGPDRAPQWPEGLIGSITHTHDYCGVAVTKRGGVVSLGLDAEPELGMRPELWQQTSTGAELGWLASLSEHERPIYAKLIFSAKESFYKCQFPLTRSFLDFEEVEVEIDEILSTFTVMLLRNTGPLHRGQRFGGKYRRVDGLLLSGMVMTRRQLDWRE